jgi:putative spermidine/putrescine transport system substrate-binding protein
MERAWLKVLVVCALAAWAWTSARAADVVCYACGSQPIWAAVLATIKADLGLDIPSDDRSAEQALSELLVERSEPKADFAYFDVSTAIKAKQAGVLKTFRPSGSDTIPADLKDPDGTWFAIHSATIGLFINKKALRGVPAPTCWKDIYKPEYRGMVGYFDPSSSMVGYVSAIAVNLALGGAINHFDPVISYFKALQANGAIIPDQEGYARVVSGEIPILFDYEFNAYRAKYTEKGQFDFVLPCEGSILFPFAVGLVKNAPHQERAERALQYVASDQGQTLLARAHVRPARPVPMPPDVKARLLPDSDYDRVRAIDWSEVAQVKPIFSDLYLAQMR